MAKQVNWGKANVKPVEPNTIEIPPATSIQTNLSKPRLHLDSGSTAGICSQYVDDFNILDVHAVILARFDGQKEQKLKSLQEQLQQAESKFKGHPLTVIEYKLTQKSCTQIRQAITDLEQDADKKTYLSLVQPYIEAYSRIGPLAKTVVFTKTVVPQPTPRLPPNETRHQIIAEFLEVARKYIPLDVVRKIPKSQECPRCGRDISGIALDGQGIRRCHDCGYEEANIIPAAYYKDSERVSSTNRTNYEDKENFQKSLLRYQGKQPNKLPTDLFTELDAYFKAYSLPIGEEVRKMPLNADGRSRGQTSLEMLWKALQERKYTEFYDDGNLITNLYWGWKLPDCSHQEDIIVDDYARTQAVFEAEPKERTSSLNTQYRLYQHLQARGFPCVPGDFKMIKGESLEYHNSVCSKMFKACGLRFQPV